MRTAGWFAGRVALIDGGATGQGAAHARAIVACGGSVVIGDYRDRAGAALAGELGLGAIYLHMDAACRADWQDALDLARLAYGKLDMFVDARGTICLGPPDGYSREQWNRMFVDRRSGSFPPAGDGLEPHPLARAGVSLRCRY